METEPEAISKEPENYVNLLKQIIKAGAYFNLDINLIINQII